jgi:hypothetical protein
VTAASNVEWIEPWEGGGCECGTAAAAAAAVEVTTVRGAIAPDGLLLASRVRSCAGLFNGAEEKSKLLGREL